MKFPPICLLEGDTERDGVGVPVSIMCILISLGGNHLILKGFHRRPPIGGFTPTREGLKKETEGGTEMDAGGFSHS